MWGSSELVVVDAQGATEQRQGQQLVSIDYKRPETWSFLLFAQLLSGTQNALDQDFEVFFTVTTGLGRAIASLGVPNIPAFITDSVFARMRWRVPPFISPGTRPFSRKWTQRTVTPPLDDTIGAGSAVELDRFVAQTIQCEATVVVPSNALGPVRFQIGAFFAPQTHIRPDWFLDGANSLKFRGNETGGK